MSWLIGYWKRLMVHSSSINSRQIVALFFLYLLVHFYLNFRHHSFSFLFYNLEVLLVWDDLMQCKLLFLQFHDVDINMKGKLTALIDWWFSTVLLWFGWFLSGVTASPVLSSPLQLFSCWLIHVPFLILLCSNLVFLFYFWLECLVCLLLVLLNVVCGYGSFFVSLFRPCFSCFWVFSVLKFSFCSVSYCYKLLLCTFIL